MMLNSLEARNVAAGRGNLDGEDDVLDVPDSDSELEMVAELIHVSDDETDCELVA